MVWNQTSRQFKKFTTNFAADLNSVITVVTENTDIVIQKYFSLLAWKILIIVFIETCLLNKSGCGTEFDAWSQIRSVDNKEVRPIIL